MAQKLNWLIKIGWTCTLLLFVDWFHPINVYWVLDFVWVWLLSILSMKILNACDNYALKERIWKDKLVCKGT